jgi:hypothetical protein
MLVLAPPFLSVVTVLVVSVSVQLQVRDLRHEIEIAQTNIDTYNIFFIWMGFKFI